MAVSAFLLLSTLIAVAEYAESRPIVTAEATGSGLADGPAGGAGEAAMAAAFVTKSKRCIIYYRNITKLEAKMEELKQALELLMEMMQNRSGLQLEDYINHATCSFVPQRTEEEVLNFEIETRLMDDLERLKNATTLFFGAMNYEAVEQGGTFTPNMTKVMLMLIDAVQDLSEIVNVHPPTDLETLKDLVLQHEVIPEIQEICTGAGSEKGEESYYSDNELRCLGCVLNHSHQLMDLSDIRRTLQGILWDLDNLSPNK